MENDVSTALLSEVTYMSLPRGWLTNNGISALEVNENNVATIYILIYSYEMISKTYS